MKGASYCESTDCWLQAAGALAGSQRATFAPSGERHEEVSIPWRGLRGGIVGAKDLRSAGDHGVATGGVVGAGFLGVGIGAGANEVAFAYQLGDLAGGAIVALEERGVGLAGIGVGEENSAAQ